MGTVGGSRVPNRKRVAFVGNVAPVGALHVDFAFVVVAAAVVADVVAHAPTVVISVVFAPLPLGGRSALIFWRSSQPVSAGLMSSSMYSSWMMTGLPTSS
jgi:hypothetical protein